MESSAKVPLVDIDYVLFTGHVITKLKKDLKCSIGLRIFMGHLKTYSHD